MFVICRKASDLCELETVICSQVIDDTFHLPVRRSHVLEDCIRGIQKILFSSQKTLLVSAQLLIISMTCHINVLFVVGYVNSVHGLCTFKLGSLSW